LNDQNVNLISPDERILAALAHITILVPFMGIIAAIVIWVTQKEKSRYVGFQALQATVFQLILVLAWFIGMGCYMGSFILSFVGMAGFASSGSTLSGPAQGFGVLGVLIPFIVFGLIMLTGLVFIIYGIVAALQALRGNAFRYAIIGDRIERFLQQGKETQATPVENIP
jgi:uncharacterized Tic20 family protein